MTRYGTFDGNAFDDDTFDTDVFESAPQPATMWTAKNSVSSHRHRVGNGELQQHGCVHSSAVDRGRAGHKRQGDPADPGYSGHQTDNR